MSRCKVSKKKNGEFSVQFNKLTFGEVLALSNALCSGSPVANDLSSYLRNGFREMVGASNDAQMLLDNINRNISKNNEKNVEVLVDNKWVAP
jgi:hypothetical protein